MKTDVQIQKDVEDELKWEPLLHDAQIRVGVLHGHVTLFGHASTYLTKLTAQQAAGRVKGVKNITNSVEIVLSPGDILPDKKLAANILDTFKWHTSIPQDRIRIKVKKGCVTLRGELEYQYQKQAALNAIKHLQGIKDVIDYITIKPQLDLSLIADDIRKTLERRADIEAAHIKIETIGNKVILKGTAHSWDERTAVAHAAWSAPGVDMVDDQIIIKYD